MTYTTNPVHFTYPTDGYPRIRHWHNGEDYRFPVSYLVAIADGADPYKLFSDEYKVKMKNGVRFDLRPCNVEMKHITEMGKDNPGPGEQYTDEELLSWIDSFVDMFEVAPSTDDMRNWPGPSHETYKQRFGSIPNAVREAGHNPRGD